MEPQAEDIRQDDRAEGSDPDRRAAWQRPELRRMRSGAAEAAIRVGIDIGIYS
jgi:hypothetical protein